MIMDTSDNKFSCFLSQVGCDATCSLVGYAPPIFTVVFAGFFELSTKEKPVVNNARHVALDGGHDRVQSVRHYLLPFVYPLITYMKKNLDHYDRDLLGNCLRQLLRFTSISMYLHLWILNRIQNYTECFEYQ